MGRALNGRPSGETVGWRIWLGPALLGFPAAALIALLSLPASHAGQVQGVFIPATSGVTGFAVLRQAEPDLKVIDQRWSGRLLFVISRRQDFAELAHSNGALIVFDAKDFGCGFGEDGSQAGRRAF